MPWSIFANNYTVVCHRKFAKIDHQRRVVRQARRRRRSSRRPAIRGREYRRGSAPPRRHRRTRRRRRRPRHGRDRRGERALWRPRHVLRRRRTRRRGVDALGVRVTLSHRDGRSRHGRRGRRLRRRISLGRSRRRTVRLSRADDGAGFSDRVGGRGIHPRSVGKIGLAVRASRRRRPGRPRRHRTPAVRRDGRRPGISHQTHAPREWDLRRRIHRRRPRPDRSPGRRGRLGQDRRPLRRSHRPARHHRMHQVNTARTQGERGISNDPVSMEGIEKTCTFGRVGRGCRCQHQPNTRRSCMFGRVGRGFGVSIVCTAQVQNPTQHHTIHVHLSPVERQMGGERVRVG